jgi:transcriptional regulator of heat shock response
VAVIGPMRMNYERVVGAVQQIGRTFEALQAGGNG